MILSFVALVLLTAAALGLPAIKMLTRHRATYDVRVDHSSTSSSSGS